MFGRAWATMLGWCAMASNRESDHVIPDGCRDGCEHETLRADGPPVEDRLLQSEPLCPGSGGLSVLTSLKPAWGRCNRCKGKFRLRAWRLPDHTGGTS